METSISEIRRTVYEALNRIDRLIEQLKEERRRIEEEFIKRLDKLRFGSFDLEQFEEFLEEPYIVIPTRRRDQWYVIAPKWINFQLGWLDDALSTKSYNVFIVNRYVAWFSEIPKALREKLAFREPLPFKVQDGYLITPENLQEEAWRTYRKYLSRRRGKDRILIKKGYEFQLISRLIEDGILPFIPRPVDPKDLRPFDKIKLRPYQEEAWETFLKTGAIGVFWPFGSGKSFLGLYALGRLRGRKLVVVPTRTLVEQWVNRIKEYLGMGGVDVDVITYHSYHKVRDRAYRLVIFDECHHLPADTFIRLATINTKYRMGFSGSPYREDGRESYIIALTGFPVGMSWEHLINMKIVRKPTFYVYVLRDERAKMRKLEELLKIPEKTIVFCDSIKVGKALSKRFGVPFVYGETAKRIEVIREALEERKMCIVSRVGDEGLSLPQIERVIEVSFLKGSRRQEAQRFGRLMHALKEEPKHIILMTEGELRAYGKRLDAIIEKGFRIQIIR